MTRLMTVLAAATLLVAACGTDEEATASATPAVVVSEDATESAAATDPDASDATDEAATDEAAVDGAEATDEELALEFAQCMRDNGFDMDDPTVGSDGSIQLFGGNPPQGDAADDAELAFESCGDILDGAAFVNDVFDDPEFEDRLLEMAQCLRDQGLDVDDPDMSAIGPGGGGGGGPFGPDFDPQDPDNAEAIESCAYIFAGFTPGGQ